MNKEKEKMDVNNNTEIFYHWNFEESSELTPDLTIESTEKSSLDVQYVHEVSEEIINHTEGSEEPFSFDIEHFDEKEQEDMLWQARTGLNPDTLCGAVETIIFMSDKPISLQKIKGQIDEELPLRVLHESLQKLQNGYEEKYHGIRLVEVAEGYQFRTKATYSKFVQNLFKINSLVLTPSALEVLAIISYKQPVTKTDIEKIRGVDSSHIVRALMDKRLVKIVGRSDELGRPSLYGTTEEFLEVFNLKDISELPPEYELEEMALKNTVGTIADIKSVVFRSETVKKFALDQSDELDELSRNIREIQPETDFTLMLKSEDKKKSSEDQPVVRKSAFEILEDYISRDESISQNKMAVQSETLLSVVETQIIDPSDQESLFNAPQIDEEFEALQAKEIQLLEDCKKSQNFESLKQDNQEELENLHQQSLELEKALDLAFENLTGEKLTDSFSADLENSNEISGLDFTVDEAASKAIDYDLDLSFLNEVSIDSENDNT